MAVNNFDRIARYYDRLASLVFGKAILESQVAFFHLLRGESKVLIVGGGSGKLLTFLPSNLEVDYLEKSENMIRLAQLRNTKNVISFLNADFLEAHIGEKYDYVICPFFLDCFNAENLSMAILKAKDALKAGGYLIVTDFEKATTSISLSKLMHVFFRAFAKLESKSLKNIDGEVKSRGFSAVEGKFFYRNMIFSRVYRNL